MSQTRLALGAWGEQQAVDYLRRQGLKILECNYRTPVGEIDIIAREGRVVVFLEVKTRRGTTFGLPQEAVGRRKQRQIARAAHWYLQQTKQQKLQARFDVIAILDHGDDGIQLDHIANAFELPC